MGWLSGHEPQLRIMIETYKRQDGEGLGETRLVREVVKISQIHQKPITKMLLSLNGTILGID
jgi:hypothetical protein